jgi:hypothetical protein
MPLAQLRTHQGFSRIGSLPLTQHHPFLPYTVQKSVHCTTEVNVRCSGYFPITSAIITSPDTRAKS